MAGGARSPSARPSSPSSSTAPPPPISARSKSSSTWCGISKGRPSRLLPRPPPLSRRTRKSSSNSGPASRRQKSDDREPDREQYDSVLRQDFVTFAARCFHDLNPQAELAMNGHLDVIAAKLTAVREGKIRRLIINVAPRNLKSLLTSIAFPAWCLGHDPSAQILSVSYAQDLADKLA